nr:transcription termination/antitermination NusG family protein [Neorhizobium tomejilense]
MKIFDAGREFWFVAQVLPGEERAAVAEMARICDREGIYLRTYVPHGRREVKNHRTHRYHVREHPALPGYAFVSINRDKMHVIRDHVVRYLGGERPIAIHPDEIQAVFTDEINGEFDQLGQSKKQRIAKLEEKFPVGSELRVVDGCFIGLSAVVKEVTGHGRISALVELFGRMTPVEFEKKQLQVS